MNSNTVRAVRLGGNWNNGRNDGFSNFNGNNAPSNGNANYGGDLFIYPATTTGANDTAPVRTYYYDHGNMGIFSSWVHIELK